MTVLGWTSLRLQAEIPATSHLTKQNLRTILDPWTLQRNHRPRRHLAICNPQSPQLAIDRNRHNPTKSDRNSCARVP